MGRDPRDPPAPDEGGGSTPEQSRPTWLLAQPGDAIANEKTLRSSESPVIGRIEDDRLLVDLRTVCPDEEDALMSALNAVLQINRR